MGLIYIFVGGGMGAVARFLMAGAIGRMTRGPFPWGTLAVNVIGGFMMGALVELMALKFSVSQDMRLFLTTGLLGGFTTFSAFSLEASSMIERGDYGLAGLYVLASVLGSVAALFGGLAFARALSP